MKRFSLRILPLLAVLGLAATPALAEKAPVAGTMTVKDNAGLFSAAGIAKAKGEFEAVRFNSATSLHVHTADKIPADKQRDFDAVKGNADQRHAFFESWARDIAKSQGGSGDVVILLYNNGKAWMPAAVADKQSDVHGHFSDAKAKAVAKMFDEPMKTVHDAKLTGAAANDKMDAVLLKATERVITELKDRPAPQDHSNVNAAHGGGEKEKGGSGIMSYVCIGLCVLLGVMLVRGLIRAFSGGGGGGGMGGGGYGGGGGGGGFMSSMLGGMFGAAAGMYMYDNFFGGHSHSSGDLGATGSSYDGGGNLDSGDGNYDGGSAGTGDGGGDWGDSGGGGGDLGGGGDWGGGGDAGGGDFGGGDW